MHIKSIQKRDKILNILAIGVMIALFCLAALRVFDPLYAFGGVLLFDPNDFVAGTKEGNPITRNEVFSAYQEYWGEKWIIIPNPMYGGWDSALYDFDYSLPPEDKFNRMYDWMDPLE